VPTRQAATELCTRWAETVAQAAVAEWNAHSLGNPQP
jgi:hypothetical protein